MHRIDGAGATADNRFTDGDPASAVPATLVTDDWLNAVQEEIVSVISDSAVTPAIALDKTKSNQLVTAIKRLISASAVAYSQATEAALGVLKISTQTQTNVGADDLTAVTPKKLNGRLTGQTFTGIAIVAGAPVTLNHSLGVTPSKLEFSLTCNTAQNGWVVGDVIHGSLENQSNPSSGSAGMGIFWYGETATQVTIGFGNGAWQQPVKGSGARSPINLANFTLTARIIP